MRYSEEIIEEVRNRNNIIDVIGSYVHLERKGSTYFGLCPFHGEKTPSFSVTPAKQMYYCFGCGRGGNVFTFVMEHENISFPEALSLLAQKVGITLPQEEMSEKEMAHLRLRDKVLHANHKAGSYFYHTLKRPSGQKGLEYLQKRGLSQETIQKFGLGFANNYKDDLYQYLSAQGIDKSVMLEAGLIHEEGHRGISDKFWNRVMFPILDVRSRVIGFGGRVLGEGNPKYLNSKETVVFDKGKNLYGLHIAKNSKADYFLLCEGYMDVIALHQHGFDNAIASLGTALTQQQAELLKRYKNKVYFLYDGDQAGQRATLRGIPILANVGIQAKVISLGEYKDPDELLKARGSSLLDTYIREAKPSFFYEIERLEDNYQLQEPAEKISFLRNVAKKLLTFEDKLERKTHLEAIAKKYQVLPKDLEDFVIKLAMESSTAYQSISKVSTFKTKSDKRKEAIEEAYRRLLTWVVENPKWEQLVWEYLVPLDFEEGIFRDIGMRVYNLRGQAKDSLSGMAGEYEDPEQAQMIAQIFHTQLNLSSQEDEEKAVKETIVKIKRYSIEQKRLAGRSEGMVSLEALREAVEDKKKLEYLEKQI